jgi:cytochrome c556
MKPIKLVTFLYAAGFTVSCFTVGCDKEGTNQQLEKVQGKATEAAQEMQDYSYARKSQFVEKMQGQLASLKRELDGLAWRIEQSSDSVKAETKPKLDALRAQTDQLNQHLDEVRNASESTWDGVKNGFKRAYELSKNGIQQARQSVSDKVAP